MSKYDKRHSHPRNAAYLVLYHIIFSLKDKKGEYIIISPQKQKEFIRQIQEINPNIRIKT
uniref:PH domain-containing protein n=1 Tax=Segatella hominis TaxID=2518605 RepID=UPI0040276C84